MIHKSVRRNVYGCVKRKKKKAAKVEKRKKGEIT